MAAHYMSIASSISSFFLGIAGIHWSNGNSALAPKETRDLCLYAGLYSIFVALIMLPWEKIYGKQRERKSLPFRGMVYCLIGVFPAVTLVTALSAAQWILTGTFDIMAWIKGEEYTQKKKKDGDGGSALNEAVSEMAKYLNPGFYVEKTSNWFTELRQQSKV